MKRLFGGRSGLWQRLGASWLGRRDGCGRVRPVLDDWLDAREAAALPPFAAEHMRECEACRRYVSGWNAIELRIRGLRDEWPSRSELAAAVRVERASGAPAMGERALRPCQPLLRPALRSALVAIAVVMLATLLYCIVPVARNRVLAHRSVGGADPLGVQAADAIQKDLPVAATR